MKMCENEPNEDFLNDQEGYSFLSTLPLFESSDIEREQEVSLN